MVEQYEHFMSVRQFFDVFCIRFWGGSVKGVLHKDHQLPLIHI